MIDLRSSVFVFSSVVASLLTAAAQAGARGKKMRIIIPQALDWLKRYLVQNAKSGDFAAITLEDA